MRRASWAPLVCAAAAFVSCGYHAGGKADLVPKNVQTISIPAFRTVTTRYKLVDILPQAIGREFQSRTRFRIVNDPSQADAVLNGTVNNVIVFPAVTDPTSGKSESVRIYVGLSVTLIDSHNGHILYFRPNFLIHQDYAAAVDPHQFFDESGPAFDRLCREVAQDVVSSVVENF